MNAPALGSLSTPHLHALLYVFSQGTPVLIGPSHHILPGQAKAQARATSEMRFQSMAMHDFGVNVSTVVGLRGFS